MIDQAATSRGRLFTTFGTVLYVGVASGRLCHGTIDSSLANAVLVCDPPHGRIVHEDEGSLAAIACGTECCRTVGGVDASTAPTVLEIIGLERCLVALRAEGAFICAESDGRITLSRSECRDWESFRVENAGGKDRGWVSFGYGRSCRFRTDIAAPCSRIERRRCDQPD